jgi:hypothetical protein
MVNKAIKLILTIFFLFLISNLIFASNTNVPECKNVNFLFQECVIKWDIKSTNYIFYQDIPDTYCLQGKSYFNKQSASTIDYCGGKTILEINRVGLPTSWIDDIEITFKVKQSDDAVWNSSQEELNEDSDSDNDTIDLSHKGFNMGVSWNKSKGEILISTKILRDDDSFFTNNIVEIPKDRQNLTDDAKNQIVVDQKLPSNTTDIKSVTKTTTENKCDSTFDITNVPGDNDFVYKCDGTDKVTPCAIKSFKLNGKTYSAGTKLASKPISDFSSNIPAQDLFNKECNNSGTKSELTFWNNFWSVFYNDVFK